MTYAATTANNMLKMTLYKPATLYAVDKDNIYTYSFEDIQHMVISDMCPSAALPKNEIVFRYVFE